MKTALKVIGGIALLLIVFVGIIYLSVSKTEDHFRTCSILNFEDADRVDFRKYDSVTVAANTLYKADEFKKIIQGEQYREVWATPVKVPIAFLDTLKGGLQIIEEGGGKQTHSLELEDSTGVRYALRSLSKDPAPLVPEIAKTLELENIIVDGVSAQHPYAALVVSALADNVKIMTTQPQLLFIPKQEKLEAYNDKYGNRLYYFEYESEGKVNWTQIDSVEELIDTEDLQELKMEGKPVQIDHNTLIRARLFDLIIGDWDRHAKQWGWAMVRNADSYLAIPIPTDRDNAFFKQDGILPTLIANDLTLPMIQSFEATIANLEGLVRPFDEYFLRTASLEQFQREALFLRESLSDPVIEESFMAWPKAIDSLHGKELRRNIKIRRDAIEKYATQFYHILKERPLQKQELHGSEDLQLPDHLAMCFDCEE